MRGFIDGVALHLAKPEGDAAYFKTAKAALRKLRRAGICHNDLAKEQNWLRGADGKAYLTDFQLAACFKGRGKLFRILAYEDLRHLLKHKRRYAPAALTPKERKVLARKSVFSRIWLVTGKKVYVAITRGLFNFTDREGGGKRLVNDAPVLIERIKANPAVRDVAIVAFADRRAGVGLYAFVEGSGDNLEASLRIGACGSGAPQPPEHIQIAPALPRDAAGAVRREILQLIAMNQVDLIEPLLHAPAERELVQAICATAEKHAGQVQLLNGSRREARHSVHSIARLDGGGLRAERLIGRRHHPPQLAIDQRQRQITPSRAGVSARAGAPAPAADAARLAGEVLQEPLQLRRRFAGEHVFHRNAGPAEFVQRQVDSARARRGAAAPR